MASSCSSSISTSSSSFSVEEATHPTFYGTIQGLFSKEYRNCMLQVGDMAFDLWNYADVVKRAAKIHDVLSTGVIRQGGPEFPKEKVDLIKTWILQGCQKGTPPPPVSAFVLEATMPRATRYRENITTVAKDPVKLEKLKNAFRLILADEKTYRSLVQIHADYCYHNSQQFFPWHRPYIIVFEDALRKIANDDTLTLPYWDFTSPEIPQVFQEEPFKAFTSKDFFESSKQDPETGLYTSQRWSPEVILAGYKEMDVAGHTHYGYQQPLWEHFTGWWPASQTLKKATMNAHNQAHNQAGPTMQNSLYSPFDPIFWFYHCNWDRVLWGWQQVHGRVSQEAFVKSLTEPSGWLTERGGLGLVPFRILEDKKVEVVDMSDLENWKLTASSADVLDATQFGIQYEDIPLLDLQQRIESEASARLPVNLKTKLSPFSIVRVENVNRVNIKGNFEVLLVVEGEVIARLGFFQAPNPNECKNCKSAGIVSFEFKVLTAKITEKPIEAKIIDSTGQEIDPLVIGVPQITVTQGLHPSF